MSTVTTDQMKFFRTIFGVFVKIIPEFKFTLKQNAKFVMLQQVVYMIATGLRRIKVLTFASVK